MLHHTKPVNVVGRICVGMTHLIDKLSPISRPSHRARPAVPGWDWSDVPRKKFRPGSPVAPVGRSSLSVSAARTQVPLRDRAIGRAQVIGGYACGATLIVGFAVLVSMAPAMPFVAHGMGASFQHIMAAGALSSIGLGWTGVKLIDNGYNRLDGRYRPSQPSRYTP